MYFEDISQQNIEICILSLIFYRLTALKKYENQLSRERFERTRDSWHQA